MSAESDATLTLVEVFERVDEALGREIAAFWVEHGALASEEGLVRARQVAFVARRADGRIAAVCTAYLDDVPALGMRLFHFRTFVAAAHRRTDLARSMIHATFELLERRYVSGVDRRSPGMFLVLENRDVQQTRDECIWPTTRLVYVGSTADGRPCRVRYFRGATIPA